MAQTSSSSSVLRIGSRGSPLALVQAREVLRQFADACGLAAEQIEIKIIRTTGDAIVDRPLAEAGGKGLFTKEIEAALAKGPHRGPKPAAEAPAEDDTVVEEEAA